MTKSDRDNCTKKYGSKLEEQTQERLLEELAELRQRVKTLETESIQLRCQENELRFRRLSEATFEAVTISENGIIIDINTNFVQMFGYERHEAIGMEVTEFVIPAYRVAVKQRISSQNEQPYEVPQLRKDGTIFLGEVRGKTVRENNHILRLTAIRDITERKRAEESLRNIAEAMPIPIIITRTSDGRIRYANERVKSLWGTSAEELIGCSAPDFYNDPNDRSRLIRILNRQGYVHGLEVQGKSASGTDFWVSVSVQPLTLDGEEALLATFYDITQRKQAEAAICQVNDELEQRVDARTAELKQELIERKRLEKEIAEVSEDERRRIGQDLHDDLGQCLAATGFLCQALEEDLITKSLVDEASVATKIKGIVGQAIAQIRHLVSGLLPLEFHSDNLISALSTLATNIESRFGILCCFTNLQEVRIHADTIATHLYRIAQEAVHNAIKHGRAKRVEIILKNEDNTTKLVVKDDGVGIGESLPDNKGMGLRIMRYRANLIGGTVKIEPDTDGGTVVTCLFYQ